MPNDAPDLSRAERLVYLFPEGFDAKRFIEGQLNGKRIFDYRQNVPPAGATEVDPHVLYGLFRGQGFAIEVRPRSATIAAEAFETRRDLLLELKEFVEKK